MPDPERLGGLEWARRTGGALTRAERRRLLGAIARQYATYAAGLVPRRVTVPDITPPDSAFAREAEEACAEQSAALVGHSYRTWAYGSALAAVDREALEPESFYVACLLHDHGLDAPVAGEDFTIRSAARAAACEHADPAAIDDIGDAITAHSLPGATVERDGALGVYVGAGAALDLIRLRAGHVPRGLRRAAVETHGRPDRQAVARLITAEARLNPKGRFALLHRCGFAAVMRVNGAVARGG